MPSVNPVLIQDVPRSRNEAPPLFLIHDASGLLTAYFKLKHLNRRLYGIWDPKMSDSVAGSWTSVHEMAEHYVRLVRRTVPRGPIVLGGWSFGGIIATHMAHLLSLHGRGLRVERILLLDSVYPRSPRPEARKDNNIHHTPNLPGVSLETRERLVQNLFRATCLSDLWDVPRWEMGMIKPPVAVLVRASEMVPMENKGDRCALDRTRFLTQLGWEDMADDFISLVLHTGGNHYTIFDEPHTDSITNNIRKALDVPLSRD